MKKILFTIALLLEASVISSRSSKAAPGCLFADILFVTDWSESMGRNDTIVFNAFNEFASSLKLSDEGIRLGFISFADTPTLDLQFTADMNELLLMEDELAIRTQIGNTNISPSLALARQVFARLPEYRFHTAKKIIVFISDGEWWPQSDVSDSILAVVEADKLRKMGIYVYAIDPGTKDSHPGLLRNIARDPSSYILSNYSGLAQALKQLDFCM